MNILILSGSPRKGGNTDLLVEAFVKDASQKHNVEVVSVHDYKVNPCMGCNACFKSESNTCVQKDDMALIYEKAALAELPEPQREVWVQTEEAGLSFNNLAAQTGMPLNTLLSRKHYAVKHLRKRLQPFMT